MQALENGMTLLDAFPFDSSPNLVYTNQGYPRGDRAVDAWTMRHTFRQFFSTGVFGTPANAFEISKGTGLTVTVQPGMCVIEGGMGGISAKSGPLTLTLGTGPAQGKTPYGIMLRYDDNSDVRGITVYAKKGTPGDDPVPPEPDTESANVHELRLGYVIVPNGASDLTNATVTNEKGLAVCPYAAPFEEIDMSQVTADAKATAIAALDSLMAYFEQYREMVDAAVDETLAGQLQTQINQLKEQLDNFDLSSSVDDKTIEYTQEFGETAKTLKVKDGGITTAKLASGAVTSDKLASDAVTADKIADGAVTADSLDQSVFDAIEPQWETLWEGNTVSRIPISSIDNYNKLRVTIKGSDTLAVPNIVIADIKETADGGMKYCESSIAASLTNNGSWEVDGAFAFFAAIESGVGLTAMSINGTARYGYTFASGVATYYPKGVLKVEGAK